MKGRINFFGIIAIVAIIGFSMVACSGSGSPAEQPVNGNEPLRFVNEWVYERVWNMQTGDYTLERSSKSWAIEPAGFWGWTDENEPIFVAIGGNGGVSEGRLNFTIGSPPTMPIQFTFMWLHNFDNVKMGEAQAFPLHSLGAEIGSSYTVGKIFRGEIGYDWINENVEYIYVDRDVTITGEGITAGNFITLPLNISLRAGWNAVLSRSVHNDNTGNEIFSISMEYPERLRWVLDPHN